MERVQWSSGMIITVPRINMPAQTEWVRNSGRSSLGEKREIPFLLSGSTCALKVSLWRAKPSIGKQEKIHWRPREWARITISTFLTYPPDSHTWAQIAPYKQTLRSRFECTWLSTQWSWKNWVREWLVGKGMDRRKESVGFLVKSQPPLHPSGNLRYVNGTWVLNFTVPAAPTHCLRTSSQALLVSGAFKKGGFNHSRADFLKELQIVAIKSKTHWRS